MAHGTLMEAELLAQARVLAERGPAYAEAARGLRGGGFEMALLVARGSSDHAALYGRYLIEVVLGLPVSLAAPSVLTRYGRTVRYPPCLAIGVSQSGAAPDVSETLSALRRQGHRTLAITNRPDSPVGEAAETVIDLGVGPEHSVAATKTYTASLLALYETVRALGGELPDPSLPDEAWVARCREAAERGVGAVVRSERWFALARGFGFATAQETALKLMECALLPCKGYSTADFQHGPRALAGHGTVAVVYGEPPAGLEAQGCLVERAPETPDTPDAPIRQIVYGQWLALLAARARGLDPDRPPHIEKVTRTL